MQKIRKKDTGGTCGKIGEVCAKVNVSARKSKACMNVRRNNARPDMQIAASIVASHRGNEERSAGGRTVSSWDQSMAYPVMIANRVPIGLVTTARFSGIATPP